MDISLILIIIGTAAIILSFFFGKSPSKNAEEIEQISISLHKETNMLKKRVRALEDELMVGMPAAPAVKPAKKTGKPVHEIIVNQILSLNASGYSIPEIAKRASLSEAEVTDVLRSRGVTL